MEATLDQLLAEPITRLLMQRDGISEGEVRRLIAEAARRQRRRLAEEDPAPEKARGAATPSSSVVTVTAADRLWPQVRVLE